MLDFLLKHFWLKPISIPISILSVLLGCLMFIPDSENESYLKLIIYISASFIALIIYSFFVYKENFYYQKAKAKGKGVGVLFIFHAQDNDTYEDVRYNIIERFNQSAQLHAIELEPVCLNANKIKNYKYKDSEQMMELLQKRNCIISIDISLQVDSVTESNEYEIRINPGVLHPKYDKERHDLFVNELNKVSLPVNKINFSKQQKIKKFNFTSEYLSVSIEYIIGLISYLNNNIVLSLKIFQTLYNSMSQNNQLLEKEITLGYFASCQCVVHYIIDNYFDTWSVNVLDEAEVYLAKMNELIPDTFGYNELSAIVNFSKYRDIKTARKNIDKCIEIYPKCKNGYNDAFLTAYVSNSLEKVYSKYKKAFISDYSAIKIIEFIENVLKDEPEKYMLHFVLGFLYYMVENYCLASEHMQCFIGKCNYKEQGSKKCVELIEAILNSSSCDVCERLDVCGNSKMVS